MNRYQEHQDELARYLGSTTGVFERDEEVRDYFRLSNILKMFGAEYDDEHPAPTQDDLDDLADLVIGYKDTSDCNSYWKPRRYIIANAFSLAMLPTDRAGMTLQIYRVRAQEIHAERCRTPFLSVVGHPDTAAILSALLGTEVSCNRTELKLGYRDILYVAQYNGPRLEPGTTVLPEGAKFEFYCVNLSD